MCAYGSQYKILQPQTLLSLAIMDNFLYTIYIYMYGVNCLQASSTFSDV